MADGCRILVVDDADEIRESMKDLLEDEGCEVLTARNGREALALLRAGGTAPCLIFLDLVMPIMDGHAFRLEQLRDSRLAQIPVIFLTAYDDLHQLDAEAIRKPFRLARVLSAVERNCRSG